MVLLLLAVFFAGRWSSNERLSAQVTRENTGKARDTLEATFVAYKDSRVATTLTSDSGDWYFDSAGALHVPYLVMPPRSESDLPVPVIPGTFYFLRSPIRIAAVDAAGTLRTSQMICEDDIYLYSELLIDSAYYWDNKWYYGDSLHS